MCKLLIVATILVLSVAANVGLASAQTTAVDVSVEDQIQRPVGCPNGAYLCGDADIVGFGSAEFRWYLVSFEPVSQSCGDYTAIVTLTLGDGSTLTLDEAGTDCGPGQSFSSYPAHSYGQPQIADAEWVVQDGTGVFAGRTGSGTNTLHITGARITATVHRHPGAVSVRDHAWGGSAAQLIRNIARQLAIAVVLLLSSL